MKNNSEPLIGQGLTRTYNHFGNIVSEKPETKKVCFDLRTLKRFLHRKSEYVKFLNSYEDEETENCLYWNENKVNILVDDESICVIIDLDENYADIDLDGCGNVYRFSLQFNTKYMSNRKSTFFKTNTKFQPTSVTLVLQRDDKGKLYFQCDNEKIENLKVWLDDPDEYVLENMFNKDDSKDFVLDDSDILALDEKECVKFSLQNVTQNIKQLDSSFNKENNDEFTIYYFVETKDSNGKYEFDSCETISLSQDKIGDKDAMLGYISVHNGNPVTTKKIKMFIARGDCKKY